MELELVKVAAKLFGTESDDLQDAAGTQVIIWQIIALPYCLFNFVILNTNRFYW